MRNKLKTTWYHMLDRCTNRNHPNFVRYGGRGIGVCDRWADPCKISVNGFREKQTKGFQNFYDDMSGTWFPNATIDRVDNDRGYDPENCRWLTRSQNTLKMLKETGSSFRGKSQEARIRANIRVKLGTHNFQLINPTKGTIWITNGSQTKRIHKDQPLPNGFSRGKTIIKGRRV